MSRRVKVAQRVHDGCGRPVSITFSDGRVLKFDKSGAPIGQPEAVIADADGFDDDSALWVEDAGGTQVLACTLGDLRRTLRALAVKRSAGAERKEEGE